jgi:hypothetical protein
MIQAQRVVLDELPFAAERRSTLVWNRGTWPAKWIAPPGELTARPLAFAARRTFSLESAATIRIHVSADERYVLFIDGIETGRGPERGDFNNWFFETYDLTLPAGAHQLVALVWALGDAAPLAQLSAGVGFVLAAESHREQLNTGIATWETKSIGGITTVDHPTMPLDGYAGKKLCFDARKMNWEALRGGGEGWSTARVLGNAVSGHHVGRDPNRALRPAMLPGMLSRTIPPGKCRHAEPMLDTSFASAPCDPARHEDKLATAFDTLLQGGAPLIVPAKSRVRYVADLNDYFCWYANFSVGGGKDAVIRLRFAESLFAHADPASRIKENRNGVRNKFFHGYADTFICDGGDRTFPALWWAAGRYLQIEIETADQPLRIDRLWFTETRYPLEVESESKVEPNTGWPSALPNCRRCIEVCAHETMVDTPLFEQLAYIGDSRLQALCHFVMTRDARMVRKMIEMFDASRVPEGFTLSRYPSRIPQLISPFSLIWIQMVHDYALWRGDEAFIRDRLPGVRAVIDAFLRHHHEGLISKLPGWSFMDWTGQWRDGEVITGSDAANAPVNWIFVSALQSAAELERQYGLTALAAHYESRAELTAVAVRLRFWSPVRGLFADDLGQTQFSEHAQALAILSGHISPEQHQSCAAALSLPTGDIIRATMYFDHYCIEALRVAGDADGIARRLARWTEIANIGIRGTPERPEPTRSDAHAWSAHPLYHAAATIAGIRPTDFVFSKIEIRPMLGGLKSVHARVPRGNDFIDVFIERSGEKLRIQHDLPANLDAQVIVGDRTIKARSRSAIEVPIS